MRIFLAVLVLFMPITAQAQNSGEFAWGIDPNFAGHESSIDSVDRQTGNLNVHIPVISLPQKGDMPPLSFYIVGNSVNWTLQEFGTPPDNYYTWVFSGNGLSVQRNAPKYDVYGYYYGISNGSAADPVYVTYPYVEDGFGGRHFLFPVKDQTISRSVDGSYYRYTLSQSTNSFTHEIIDAKGIRTTLGCDDFPPTGICGHDFYKTIDHFDNVIDASTRGQFTDTWNRTVPDPGTDQTQSGCRNSSYPSSLGSDASIQVCWSNLSIQTHFLSDPNTVGNVSEGTAIILAVTSLSTPRGAYTFEYDSWGSLHKITLPRGGSITYEWTNVSDTDPRSSTRKLSSRTVDDANGHVNTWTYSGDGNVFQISGPDGTRKYTPLSNPETEILEDPDGTVRTVKTTYAAYNQFFSNTFLFISTELVPVEIETSWPDGTVSKTCKSYTQNTTSCISTPVDVQGTTPQFDFYDYNEPFVTSSGTTTYHTAVIHSLSVVDDLDGGSGSPGPLLRRQIQRYVWQAKPAYLDANFIGAQQEVETRDTDGTLISKAEFEYDNDPNSPQGTLGLITKKTVWPDSSHSISTLTSYNSQGHPIVTHDGRGNATTISYQCDGIYPYETTNALSITTRMQYDCMSGALTNVADPNDIAAGRLGTVYSYEASGDLKHVSYPDGGSIDYDRANYVNPLVLTTTIAQGQSSIITSMHYDGLGRVVKRTTSAPEGATSVDQLYDAAGNVTSVSAPYRGTEIPLLQHFTHDILRRLRSAQFNDEPASVWTYSGQSVDVIDASGPHSKQSSDALGRLRDVWEPDGSNTPSIHTRYSYNANADLTSVNQLGASGDAARMRSFTYDGLSRLVAAKNPEQGGGLACDGALVGTTWSACFSYDANGNIGTKTDARGVVTTYTYDALNRLTSRKYSGETDTTHPTPSSCYVYDTGFDAGLNPIGRLAAEWTQAGDCSTNAQSIPSSAISWKKGISYDAMGRLTDEIQCPVAPCSAPNPMHYVYDLVGNITHQGNGLANSQSPQIGFTNSYDAAGRLKLILSDWGSAGHPVTLFEADQPINGVQPYGPFGLTAAQYGIAEDTPNSVALAETRIYDSRGRITLKNVIGSAQAQIPTTTTVSFNTATNSFTLGDQPLVPVQVSCNSACGLVQFMIDGNNWSTTLPLDSSGKFNGHDFPSNLTVGNHYVQVQYLGDATHAPSISNRLDFTLLPIGSTPSSISVSLSPSSSTFTFGDQPIVPVQVNCNSACGRVQFMIDGGNWSNPKYLDSNGHFDGYGFPASLALGQHYIQVAYLGNSTYAPSTSTQLSFTLANSGTTQTTVTASLEPPLVGVRVSDLATITVPTQVGCNFSCGMVSFTIDGNQWGNGNGYRLDSSGQFVAYNLPLLSVGQHEIRANYLGNPVYAPVTSNPLMITVIPDSELPTSTTLSLNPAQSTFTLADQPDYPTQVSCNTSCGNVQFTIDNTNWSVPFALNSTGQFNGHDITPNFLPGTHFMRVQYLGNGTYAPSISAKLPFTIVPVGTASTTINVSLSPLKSSYSQSDLLTTTVPIQVGCNSACGRLQFYIDGNQWGPTLRLNSSGYFAGYGFPSISSGTHHISVQYLGNATYAPTSGGIDITVTN